MFYNSNNLDYIRRYLCAFESSPMKLMDEEATEKKHESDKKLRKTSRHK